MDTSEFAALRDELDGLRERVGQLEHQAFMLRTLEEMRVRYWYGENPDVAKPVRRLRAVDGT